MNMFVPEPQSVFCHEAGDDGRCSNEARTSVEWHVKPSLFCVLKRDAAVFRSFPRSSSGLSRRSPSLLQRERSELQ